MSEEFPKHYFSKELGPKETKREGFESESIITPERAVNLSKSIIGIRVFKVGEFDQKSLEQFKRQVESVKSFSQYLKKAIEKPPQVAIITNSDLPEIGKQILAANCSDIMIVPTEPAKVKRRAKLARVIIGEKSAAKGKFGYADMLNTLLEKTTPETEGIIFASSDLTIKQESLSRQIIGMKILYDQWQKERPNQIAIIGSLIEAVHDRVFIEKLVDGEEELKLGNLHKIFPNNALSLVPREARFSGITDDALAGRIEAGGQLEPIGGEEDFLYGLRKMIYDKKDCVLLIEPFVPGKREYEVKGVESKYIRRPLVYDLYARRVINQAFKRGKIDSRGVTNELTRGQVETIVKEIIDKHLFFARIDQNNRPEIILTQRQKSKLIKPPI